MSSDYYKQYILPYAAIIIKICRAYTNTQEDFEDYYQEICLQLWKSESSYRGNAKRSTWIYRISLNVCLTLLKKKKAGIFVSEPVLAEVQEDASEAFDNRELNALYDAIRQLSEIDRAIILLYLEEKSYKEIASIIGTNSNHIGVRINRIKERLKKLLDGKIN